MDRRRQVGQEPACRFERLLFRIDRVIHRTASGLDAPAAEFLLRPRLPQPFHDRRAGDEHRGDFFHHDGVMGRDQSGGAEAGNRAQAKADNGNLGHLVGDEVE